MPAEEQIRGIFQKHGLSECGFVRYSELLPLLECRAKARIPANADTVIVCLFPYFVDCREKRNLSRYAIVEDYHHVAKMLLGSICEELQAAFPTAAFAPFADNSPIREVTAAVRAGLGVLGRNQLLLHPKYGSYVFIGEVVTDLKLQTTAEERQCIGCGNCVAACPANAITAQGIVQERCISCLTQRKGELSAEEAALVKRGGLLWGCDACQEACPYNQSLPETPLAEFRKDVISWVEADRIEELVKTRAFGFRGSGVLKRNFTLLYGTRDAEE